MRLRRWRAVVLDYDQNPALRTSQRPPRDCRGPRAFFNSLGGADGTAGDHRADDCNDAAGAKLRAAAGYRCDAGRARREHGSNHERCFAGTRGNNGEDANGHSDHAHGHCQAGSDPPDGRQEHDDGCQEHDDPCGGGPIHAGPAATSAAANQFAIGGGPRRRFDGEAGEPAGGDVATLDARR